MIITSVITPVMLAVPTSEVAEALNYQQIAPEQSFVYDWNGQKNVNDNDKLSGTTRGCFCFIPGGNGQQAVDDTLPD